MKKFIVIKTQFEAIHSWSDCDIPEVDFLRFPHRDMFYVTMKFPVFHNDRETEFIVTKHRVEDHLNANYNKKLIGNMSCEDIAQRLLETFHASFVSVFEDNENGAEIYAD